MWPKLFSQLVELLPHITRLIPMADLFFQSQAASRSAGDKASQTVLAALAQDVRADLGRVTAAHDGLYRQLQAQSAAIAEAAATAGRAHAASEISLDRLTALEEQTAVLRRWLLAAVLLLLLTLSGVIVLLIRTR